MSTVLTQCGTSRGYRPSATTKAAATLGRRVVDAWRSFGFDDNAFPSIATEALSEATVLDDLTLEGLLDCCLVRDDLPFQQSFESTFGEPPLTLFWHPRFHIEALCWASLTPSIHSHGFAGAFTPIHGASLQTTYQFEPLHHVSEALVIGQVATLSTTTLTRGEVETISPGDALIHSVFHLYNPSISLVIRTRPSVHPPQFEYLPPHVRVQSWIEDQAQTRRLQLLNLLATSLPDEFRRRAPDFGRDCEAATVFSLLRSVALRREYDDVAATLVEIMAERWGEPLRALTGVLEEVRRRNVAITMRSKVKDPGLRAFVGLLLSHACGEPILDALSQMNPSADPRQTASTCIAKLAAAGLLPFTSDSTLTKAVQETLQSLSTSPAQPGLSDPALAAISQKLRDTPLLRPLFTASAA